MLKASQCHSNDGLEYRHIGGAAVKNLSLTVHVFGECLCIECVDCMYRVCVYVHPCVCRVYVKMYI